MLVVESVALLPYFPGRTIQALFSHLWSTLILSTLSNYHNLVNMLELAN
jgi:hypothetical protein